MRTETCAELRGEGKQQPVFQGLQVRAELEPGRYLLIPASDEAILHRCAPGSAPSKQKVV
jgi:hypothetical protein